MAQQKTKPEDDWVDIPAEDDWQDIPEAEDSPFPAGKAKSPSQLGKFLDWASTPLTDAPSRFSREKAESFYGDTAQSKYPRLMGFFKGADEALGDIVSGLTSPVGLALTATGLGEYATGARGLTAATKALSTIPLAHGVKTAADKDKSLFERGMGVAEAAGGLAGTMHGPSAPSESPKPTSRFAKGEVINVAGKDQVVTGFDKSGKPIMKIAERPKISDTSSPNPEISDTPLTRPKSAESLAAEEPLNYEPKPETENIVDKLFPGLEKRDRTRSFSMEPIQRFLDEDSGEFNVDAILGPEEIPQVEDNYAGYSGTSLYKPETAKEMSRLMVGLMDEGNIKDAFSHAQEKYPRLMGHVGEINIGPNESQSALSNLFNPGGSGSLNNSPLSRIRVNPDALGNITDAGVANTVGHELTHAAQRLRKGATRFGQEYSEANAPVLGSSDLGYLTNPFERSARRSGSRFSEKFQGPIRRFLSDESGEFNPNFMDEEPIDIGEVPESPIDLNEAALAAGADLAKPIEGRRLPHEFSEDVAGSNFEQPEIPPQVGPAFPHEFQPDMPFPGRDVIDQPAPSPPMEVEYAFDWPDFHEDGSPERMYNVIGDHPEAGSTLSEGTLRERGVQLPEPKSKLQQFMEDESGSADFSGLFGPEDDSVSALPPGTQLLTDEGIRPGLPIQEIEQLPPEKQSMFRKVLDFPKGAMSVDLPFMTSAAFRQAKPLAWTADWFKAWGEAAKAYGSEAAAKQINADIMNSKYFKPRYKPSYDVKGNLKGYKEMPSVADQMGVKMTTEDFTGREEFNRSQLAEQLPGIWGDAVKRSNRAYGAFLNHLRKTKFEQLMDQTKWSGMENDVTIAKGLAEFVNDATGRGSLKWEGPGGRKANLERYAPVLQNALWSPRLIAANTKFLNPFTYVNLPPAVRQQYINGTLRMASTWVGFAGLAKMAGADVNLDPTNSDFGKIRIGNMRIDPAGGLQQLVVFAARELPQAVGQMTGTKTGRFTSSTTGRTREYGQGAFPVDRASVAEDFITSKLNPEIKLAYDLMRASNKRPVHLGDRAVQMALPLMAQDLMDVMKKDPDLAKMLGMSLSSSVGMGTGFYGKGERFNDPVFTDSIESSLGLPKRSLSGTVGKF